MYLQQLHRVNNVSLSSALLLGHRHGDMGNSECPVSLLQGHIVSLLLNKQTHLTHSKRNTEILSHPLMKKKMSPFRTYRVDNLRGRKTSVIELFRDDAKEAYIGGTSLTLVSRLPLIILIVLCFPACPLSDHDRRGGKPRGGAEGRVLLPALGPGSRVPLLLLQGKTALLLPSFSPCLHSPCYLMGW